MKDGEIFYSPAEKIYPWNNGSAPLYDAEKKIFIDWNDYRLVHLG